MLLRDRAASQTAASRATAATAQTARPGRRFLFAGGGGAMGAGSLSLMLMVYCNPPMAC